MNTFYATYKEIPFKGSGRTYRILEVLHGKVHKSILILSKSTIKRLGLEKSTLYELESTEEPFSIDSATKTDAIDMMNKVGDFKIDTDKDITLEDILLEDDLKEYKDLYERDDIRQDELL